MRMMGSVMKEIGEAMSRGGRMLKQERAMEPAKAGAKRLIPLGDRTPIVKHDVFIAPNATLVGDVKCGKGASVFYGSVLRGDVNHIRIGEKSVIGDRVVVHCAKHNPGGPRSTVVEDRVVVSEGALLHACHLKKGAFLDLGAVCLDGAVVGEGSVVGPGSTVTASATIGRDEYWEGSPAKKVRNLTEEEIEEREARVETLYNLSKEHQRYAVYNPETIEKAAESKDLRSFYDMGM